MDRRAYGVKLNDYDDDDDDDNNNNNNNNFDVITSLVSMR
jgi:hypothetical protein